MTVTSDIFECPHCGNNSEAQIPYRREFEVEPRVVFCRHCREKCAVKRVSYLIAEVVE